MSGGQKINDHSSWTGKGSKGSVFAEGVKTEMHSSAASAGAENDYEDTTASIKRQQDMGAAKVKAHPMKPEYRN